MAVSWNQYIPQRGAKFAIRESSFGRGRQVAPVMAAPGSLNSQRVSIDEFNRLLDSDHPTPPIYPQMLALMPLPEFGARPVLPMPPTYTPAWSTPIGPVVTAAQSGPVAQVATVAPSGALPPQSNFLDGVRFSAWWGYREGAINQLCATQGRAFITALRNALHLPLGVVWDAAVQTALISIVMQLATTNPAAWASTVTQLQSDLAAQRVSGLSLLVGIYATYYAGNNRRLDAIVVPPNTVMPIWGQAPADDHGQDGLVCYDPDTETPDAPRGGIPAAISESTTGIRVGEGRIVTGLGTVYDAPPVSAGVGFLGFLAVAVGIGAVAWAVTPSER